MAEDGHRHTEPRPPFGKAYLAPACGFGDKEIMAWPVSEHPDLARQEEMFAMPAKAKPGAFDPALQHGRQHRHDPCVSALRENGCVQSMPRKGNCLDNGAVEQAFGRLKDEFFRGRDRDEFESFKKGLRAYIHHWNHARNQAKLKDLAPAEFWDQAPQGIA